MFREQIGEDYKAILNGEFSENVTVSDGSQSVDAKGVFDKTYQAVDPQTNTIIMSDKPRVSLYLSDVPFTIRQCHTVIVRSVTYKVRELQPDGEGAVTLYLD